MKLLVSSSAALWIIKRHFVVDLESSCRVDPCEFAAESGETWKLFRLDNNQTARGKTQAGSFMSCERTRKDPALEMRQKTLLQTSVVTVARSNMATNTQAYGWGADLFTC